MHVKPGKGSAFVRTTLKNVITGKNLDRTFNPTEKLEDAQVDVAEMQYLYKDGDNYIFMDTTTYEQTELKEDQISDTLPYLKDNMLVKVLSYKGNIFGVVIGATLMGVINMGMSIMGVEANYQKVVKGLVLLIAIVFDVMSKKQKK